MGAQLEVRIAHRDRDYGAMRAALGVGFAAEALAIAAILAAAEFRAVRIGVRLRGVGRRPRERVIAGIARGIGEHLACQDRRQRRQRVVAGARRLERIAAGLDLAADIAGLAGDRRGIFELVVIGLELGVADAPVLDRHIVGDEFLAVALFIIGA